MEPQTTQKTHTSVSKLHLPPKIPTLNYNLVNDIYDVPIDPELPLYSRAYILALLGNQVPFNLVSNNLQTLQSTQLPLSVLGTIINSFNFALQNRENQTNDLFFSSPFSVSPSSDKIVCRVSFSS